MLQITCFIGKLAPLHNLLPPLALSAILLFTHFRVLPYILRHVYDRLIIDTIRNGYETLTGCHIKSHTDITSCWLDALYLGVSLVNGVMVSEKLDVGIQYEQLELLYF